MPATGKAENGAYLGSSRSGIARLWGNAGEFLKLSRPKSSFHPDQHS